jgi:hypothetical protein
MRSFASLRMTKCILRALARRISIHIRRVLMSEENVIKITERALKYLKKKGKLQVTIGIPENRLSSESVLVPVPEIIGRKPKAPENYQIINVDGIDVYISKSLVLPKEVEIDLDTFLGIKLLRVSGFKSNEG